MLPAYGQYAVSLLQICCQPIANRLTAYKGYACRIFGFCCAGNAFSTGRRILRPVRAGDAYPFPLFPYAALPPTLRSPLRSAPGTFGGGRQSLQGGSFTPSRAVPGVLPRGCSAGSMTWPGGLRGHGFIPAAPLQNSERPARRGSRSPVRARRAPRRMCYSSFPNFSKRTSSKSISRPEANFVAIKSSRLMT
jgi:hypothetical protein